MRDDGSASTAMLGLDGFVLLGVSTAFGELEQVIETTSGGREVTLVWLKRLWRCAEQLCPVSTWSETSDQLRPRASLSERARAEACASSAPTGWTSPRLPPHWASGWPR